MKPTIFIGYSHKDERWKDRLVRHLRVLADEHEFQLWDDRRIGVGANWVTEIEAAIASASVAVLLISVDFLVSDFIKGVEVPTLLRRYGAEDLEIIPVIVSPCAWRRVPWLAARQARPKDGRPLEVLSSHDSNSALARLAEEIGYILADSSRGVAVEIPPLSISRVHLSNIRRFADVDLAVRDPTGQPRPATVLIGRNGTCKTTLLRSLALGLCDAGEATSLLAEPIGRLVRSADTGHIEIGLQRKDGTSLALTKRLVDNAGKDVIEPNGPDPEGLPFVCGYGAGRWGTGEDLPERYSQRSAMLTLFRYREPLHGVELTLRRLQDRLASQFQPTMTALTRVLGLTDVNSINVAPGGGVELSGPTFGAGIPLAAWADGYRLTLTWLIDLYAWALKARRIADDGHIDGILLIDEPEQHLHPSMQAAILPRLRAALPRMQLFVTTHSPLVALGAEPGEIVVLREQGAHVVAEQPTIDFSGYSAEDMLVDRQLFDTIPYAPDTARKLERYRALMALSPEARTSSDTEELSGLTRELRSQQLPEVRGGEAVRELRALLEKHGL